MVFWDPGNGQRRRLPAVVAGAASPGPERGALCRRRVPPVSDALGDHRDGDAGVEAGAVGAIGPKRRRGRLQGPRRGGDAGPPAVQPDGQQHARRRERRGRDAGGDPDEHLIPIVHPCGAPPGASPPRQRTCRARPR